MTLDTKAFWAVIDEQVIDLRAARTADDVLRILATKDNPYHDPSISHAPAFFAGSGGDKSVMNALLAAGWTVTWAEASYYYTMTAPNGSSITYIEGDIFPGGQAVMSVPVDPKTTTRVIFYVDMYLDRVGALYRRDEIVEHLKELGIRLSMTDDGLYVYLVDRDVPTASDTLTGMVQARTKAEGQ